jgi:hypothetical protein
VRVSPAAWQSRAIKRQCRLIGFRKDRREAVFLFVPIMLRYVGRDWPRLCENVRAR